MSKKNIFSYPKSMKNTFKMMMKKLRGQIITLMDTKKQDLSIINYLTFQRIIYHERYSNVINNLLITQILDNCLTFGLSFV